MLRKIDLLGDSLADRLDPQILLELFVRVRHDDDAKARHHRGAVVARVACVDEVLLVDTNHHETQAARIEGLESYYGSVLSEDFELTAPLDGLGHFLALTHNDEVNSLACVHFAPIFGRGHTFQIAPEDNAHGAEEMPLHLRGKMLFGEQVRFWSLESRFRHGAVVKSTRLGDEFKWEDFLTAHEREDAPVLPLFVVRADGKLRVVTAGPEPDPQSGDTVIAIVDPPPE